MTGMFEVSLVLDFHRLPELFCGFVRRPGQGLTRYPVACNLQPASLGGRVGLLWCCRPVWGSRLSPRSIRLQFSHPIPPEFIDKMQIKNLMVGAVRPWDSSCGAMTFDVGITVTRRREGRSGVGEIAASRWEHAGWWVAEPRRAADHVEDVSRDCGEDFRLTVPAVSVGWWKCGGARR